MENISSTTLTEFTLRDDAAALESSADGLIAHELAHQWWGDLVTCKDWSHLWLNEGFATYFDALFAEYDKGDDEFAYKMRSNRQRGISVDAQKPRPVVWRGYKRPFEMFDARAYPKGASILHMLRGYLGRGHVLSRTIHVCTQVQQPPGEDQRLTGSAGGRFEEETRLVL